MSHRKNKSLPFMGEKATVYRLFWRTTKGKIHIYLNRKIPIISNKQCGCLSNHLQKKKLNISTAAEVHLINTSSTCLLKKFGKVRTISKLESRKQSVWTSQCILIFHDISSVEHSYLKPNKKSPIVPSTPNASHPTLHIWRSLDNTFI